MNTKLIITEEYTRYGGGSYNTLYLDEGIAGNVQLCLTQDWSVICVHLTSTDDGYIEWLKQHHASLLLISEQNWYKSPERTDGGKYHWEFYRILHNLNDLVIK